MEGNVRRRRRNPAAGMPETQPINQPQYETEQDLSVQEQCLVPAYQRRQAASRQMEQAAPAAQPVRRTVQNAYTPQYTVTEPLQEPVRSTPRTPVNMPVQPVAEPVQPVVRQRRAAVRSVQMDDEPVQLQEAYVPQIAQPQEAPVQRTAPVKKKAAPKAEKKKAAKKIDVKKIDIKKMAPKKKEKPSGAAEATYVDYSEPIQLPRKKWVAFFLCLLGGMFGLHKFYERKIGKGILYMLTVGLAGFGILIDLISLLRKPPVYYVEVKRHKPLLQAIKDFRFDIVGYIISGVGAVIISLCMSVPEFREIADFMSPAIGAVVMLVGAVLSFVYTRELVTTLIINGAILLGVIAFVFFAILVIGIVVIEIVGLIFNINIIGLIIQLFSKDDTGEAGAMHNVKIMPATILGDDGQLYHCSKRSAHAAVYVGERSYNEVTIHDNDISPNGHSAIGMGRVFEW